MKTKRIKILKLIGQKTENKQTKKACILSSAILLLILILPFSAFSAEIGKNGTFKTAKEPQIMQVKPNKPVKIKLKRSAKGEYSWDLAGDSVDEVVKADKRLKKLLNIE